MRCFPPPLLEVSIDGLLCHLRTTDLLLAYTAHVGVATAVLQTIAGSAAGADLFSKAYQLTAAASPTLIGGVRAANATTAWSGWQWNDSTSAANLNCGALMR